MRTRFASGLSVLSLFFFLSCNSDSPSDSNNNNNGGTGATKATGRVSLTVSVDGSRTYMVGDMEHTKYVIVDAELVYDLTEADILTMGGTRNVAWADQRYGGAVYWFEELIKKYQCNNKEIRDMDSTTRTFSSASEGGQPGGVQLGIMADGSYTISVASAYSGTPTKKSSSSWVNCETPVNNRDDRNEPGVPFLQYFTPFVGGAMGYFSGKIDNANPNRINGSYHVNDEMILHSSGANNKVTIPVDATITWDITLSK